MATVGMKQRKPVAPAAAFAVATLGIAFFAIMDAVMKSLTLELGVYNAMLWRIMAAAVMCAAVWLWRGPRRPAPGAMRFHLMRGVVGAVMALLFFWGLARVPMAQAIALTYIAPLLALFLAAVLLGERIGRATILASLVAFAGVLLVMFAQWEARLGHEAFLGALAILASAVCYAWNIILMRQQALVADPSEIAFFQTLIMLACLLLGAPFLAVVPAAEQVPSIILSAGLATISLFLLSWAYARGEANYLAPTEYTSFLWATALGWMVFGERVSLLTIAGAALIVTGCIWVARRGARVADTEAQLP